MSRKYLATLAVVAALILTVGLFVRSRLVRSDAPTTPAPPSQAATLQQLSREAQLRRMSGYLAERVAAVAPAVTYLSTVGAAGVRWSGDTVVSTQPGRLVVLARAPDTLRSTAVAAGLADSARPDSVRRDWVLVVGRAADGRVLSATGLAGGRGAARCATSDGQVDVEEFLLNVPLADPLAGAGLFDLDGRALGVVVRCGDRLAALPVRAVARLLAVAAPPPALDGYGLAVAPLDARTRTYFQSDTGLLVTEVRRGGPADAAGLRVGDLIVGLDGRVVVGANDAAVLDGLLDAGPAASHTLVRRRGPAVAIVRLAPADRARGDTVGGIGVDFTPAAPPRGVPITTVRPGSAAAAAGLRAGDRLLRVGDVAVTTPAAAERLLPAAGGAPTFVVYERDAVERGVLIPAGTPPQRPSQGAPR